MSDELTDVELLQGMRDLAKLTHTFYTALRDEGFEHPSAIMLTDSWLSASTARPAGEEE